MSTIDEDIARINKAYAGNPALRDRIVSLLDGARLTEQRVSDYDPITKTTKNTATRSAATMSKYNAFTPTYEVQADDPRVAARADAILIANPTMVPKAAMLVSRLHVFGDEASFSAAEYRGLPDTLQVGARMEFPLTKMEQFEADPDLYLSLHPEEDPDGVWAEQQARSKRTDEQNAALDQAAADAKRAYPLALDAMSAAQKSLGDHAPKDIAIFVNGDDATKDAVRGMHAKEQAAVAARTQTFDFRAELAAAIETRDSGEGDDE